jgi:hypothetical protein
MILFGNFLTQPVFLVLPDPLIYKNQGSIRFGKCLVETGIPRINNSNGKIINACLDLEYNFTEIGDYI